MLPVSTTDPMFLLLFYSSIHWRCNRGLAHLSRFIFALKQKKCRHIWPMWSRDVNGLFLSMESKEVEIFRKTCRNISWMFDPYAWLFVPR